jgi:hypothetical protein
MRYEATNKRIYKDTDGILRINKWLMLLWVVVLSLSAGITIVQAQVALNPITINVGNSAYAKTQATGQSDIRNITSSVPAVATALEWGTNDVKITGKTPGVALIRFFDRSTGTNYRVTVTVNAKPVNQPAGGGNQNNGGNVGDNQGGVGNNGGGNSKPQKIEDFTPFGKPEKKPIEGGGYKEVIKNKAGQVVQEKEYDKQGKLIKTRDIEEVYSNNKPAKVSVMENEGTPTMKSEEIYYDETGKVVKTETYTEPDKFDQMTKKEVRENGKTTIYKRDPKTDKWVLATKDVKKEENKQDENNKGKIDKCMVGTWVSESVSPTDLRTGGSGIVLDISADGVAAISYEFMQELKFTDASGKVVSTDLWSGTAIGQIATDKGTVKVESVKSSALTWTFTVYGKTTTRPLSDLGHAISRNTSYVCTEQTLTLKEILFGTTVNTFNFKREK